MKITQQQPENHQSVISLRTHFRLFYRCGILFCGWTIHTCFNVQKTFFIMHIQGFFFVLLGNDYISKQERFACCKGV